MSRFYCIYLLTAVFNVVLNSSHLQHGYILGAKRPGKAH